jgi:hypothetical protein
MMLLCLITSPGHSQGAKSFCQIATTNITLTRQLLESGRSTRASLLYVYFHTLLNVQLDKKLCMRKIVLSTLKSRCCICACCTTSCLCSLHEAEAVCIFCFREIIWLQVACHSSTAQDHIFTTVAMSSGKSFFCDLEVFPTVSQVPQKITKGSLKEE